MVSPRWLLAVVLGVLGACSIEEVGAQDQKAKQVILPLDRARPLKMASGKFIKDVRFAKEGIVRASPAIDDPTTIIFTGVAPGQVEVDLTDEDGKKETLTFLVRRILGVPFGDVFTWQWPWKKAIKTIVLENQKLANLRLTDTDRTKVGIEPLTERGSWFTLTDGNGKSETIGLEIRKPGLMLTVGATGTLALKGKKPIVAVYMPDAEMLEVKVDPSAKDDAQVFPSGGKGVNIRFRKAQPAAINVTAKVVGLAAVILEDIDGKPETVYVGVKPSK